MITAMQMMLNDLISKREAYENAKMYQCVATLETSIELAEYLLEKEKEQLMIAYNDGNFNAGLKVWETSSEYYNKKYQNN